MNLLSVDWDFFFPKIEDPTQPKFRRQWALYDWGHKESNLFIHTLWPIRASAFTRYGVTLPTTTGEEQTFWRRFHIKPRATLFVAESHSQIAAERVLRDVQSVWSFDAHHDAGYTDDLAKAIERILSPTGEWTGARIACDNWMLYYRMRGIDDLHVRYPRWRHYWKDAEEGSALDKEGLDRALDDGAAVPIVFERLFVCRSGAWTPPWVDDRFEAFIKAAPVRRVVHLQEIESRDGWRQAMEEGIEQMRELERNRKALEAASKAIEETGSGDTAAQVVAQVRAQEEAAGQAEKEEEEEERR